MQFYGHPEGTRWASLSPDGQFAFTQGSSTIVKWDAHTGQAIQSFKPLGDKDFSAEPNNANTAPDGVRILLSSRDETIADPFTYLTALINLKTGKVEAKMSFIQEPQEIIWGKGQQAMAFIGEGVWFWHEGMSELKPLTDNEETYARGIAFSADNQRLYVLRQNLAAYDSTTGEFLHDLSPTDLTGRNGQPLTGWCGCSNSPHNYHNYLYSSPYGPFILIGTDEGGALFNTHTRKVVTYLNAEIEDVRKLWWSEDGQRLFVPTDSNTITAINTATGAVMGMLDGTRVISSDGSGNAWTDVGNYFLKAKLPMGLDTDHILASSVDSSPVQVDATGRPVRWLQQNQSDYVIRTPTSSLPLKTHFTRAAHYSPDGKLLVSLGDHDLKFIDSKTHKEVANNTDAELWAYDFAYSPDSRLIAVDGYGGLSLLDGHTGKLLKTLNPPENQLGQNGEEAGPRGMARSVAFSPDGKWLAVGYEASAIGLWDVQKGQLVRVLKGSRGWVLSLSFSPDGKTLASGWGDGKLHLYDVASGKEQMVRQVNTKFLRAVAFSPDGQQVAAASGDGSVSLWQSNGTPLKRLTGHSGAATALSYLSNHTLISADAAGTLRQWDTSSGKLLAAQKGSGALVQSLSLSPDGQHLLSSDRDNALRIYDPQ